MMERMWNKGNIPPLMVGVQTYSATLEINVSVSQKIGNQSTSVPSNIILRHIPKGCTLIPQGHCSTVFRAALFIITRTWKQPRCPSTDEWMKKMWYNCTM